MSTKNMKKLFFVVLFFVILLGLWLVRENIFPHNDSLSDMEVQQYIEA